MSETTPDRRDARHARDEYPSGWLALTRNESVAYIIDALLDAPAYREYTQSELAAKAGVSRKSVQRHLDLLLEAGILTNVGNTGHTRYRFNPESEVSEHLIQLDGALARAGPNAPDDE